MRHVAFILFFTAATTAITAQQTPTVAYIPPTPNERWQHYLHQTILFPGFYFAGLAVAGGLQLTKDPPEWGQGVKGYSERAGSFLATYGIQSTIHEGGDAVLGYDPRYTPCNCKGGARRIAHAFVWSFLTKNGQGHTRFNAPVVAGAYGSEMLSYLWYPSRYSPLKDGFREGSQEVGITVGINIFREFSPELKRFFHFAQTP